MDHRKYPFVDSTEFDRISPSTVQEGDIVCMCWNAHSYDEDGAGAVGKVVDTPRDSSVFVRYSRPMVDIAIELEDGTRLRWEVDNGYVTESGRVPSDIGKMRGFYPPEAAAGVEE